MASAVTKKLEQLNQKILSLKQEKQKVQEELAREFVNTLQNTPALSLDFPTFIGGVLDAISKIQSGASEKEEWQKAEGRFLRSLAKIQTVKDQNSPAKTA